ncbi:SH3 domain-containing YSC84-like protein 1 [Cyphellophora attinorum]|uniref:SH3 domain-containing YSC84-like protein 1 n=1 Tax=Cyphellophora attinorum TaxID=1664694 RepID=A0A0N1H044_9EURO|nr:SH3 domain-containing YSC84-like protein 1 [Phialophora attinorum]KPI37093.1 SH3 domain-containing YSC84-like protein 1 [Phialophora attinorum]
MAKDSAKKETDSAAKILTSFLKKIPPQVLAEAKGLAIFSGFRGGMWVAGSGGSGVVVARLPDGTWSPPSAFQVRSGSFGLSLGIDVFDCIAVLNTPEALAAYYSESDAGGKVVMGGGISVAAGPVASTTASTSDSGSGGKKAVYTYTKSMGLYGGVTVDGTVIKANQKVNEAWYGQSGVTVEKILRGDVKAGEWPTGGNGLREVLAGIP